MPKWDKTRNYYADLEVQPSATPDEIKRQFKKLALKYHPDRNPGREAEVNPKFQVIQSAHEILTDETLKRQYDEARRSYATRYPGASGVRGNPWQDAAKAYPPPPRRQPNTQTRPTSGAQRYEDFGMPRNARPHTPKDDPQFRRSNAEAWDHIRPNSRKNAQPRPTTPGRAPPGRAPTSATRDSRPGPAPVPPRSAYQKQKADAAFGTSKKTGFTPRSPAVADEPPVSNKNYYTNRTHSNLFTEPVDMTSSSGHDTSASAAADPLAPFRDRFMDNRQRTPYHTPGGEKTGLFDSSPGLGRSTSTRTPPRAFEMPGAYPHTRPRSTSPTRSSSNDGGSEDSIKTKTGINRAAGHNSQTAQSRAGERYKPKVSQPADIPSQPATTSQKFMSSSTAAQPNGSGPSVYDPQIFPTPTASSRPNRSCERVGQTRNWLPYLADYRPPDPSSEENPRSSTNLLPLEEHQRRTLDRLLRNYSIANGSGGENDYTTYSQSQHALHYLTINNGKVVANSKRVYSFNFSDGVNAANTSASYKSFARNSAENINTRFVDDDVLDDWQFKAGSASANEATTASKPRPPSRNRPNRRQTPLSKPTLSTPMPEAPDVLGETNTRTQGFSAGAWSEQIGPQHFEPQSSKSASTSPTRRAPPKKFKSFKMTAGTAAVVDDDESEERQDVHRYSPGPTPGPASMAPDAMDIDTPPADKTEEIPEPVKVNGARKYSTEPYRADWRAGDVNGVASKTAGPPLGTAAAKNDISETKGAQPIVDATKNCSLRHGGSEDSEEFRTTFSEFKNVEPFMDPSPSGLKSFADLRSTLPFESRPSEQIPLDTKPPVGPLEFPSPPIAPRLPPTMGVASLRPNNSSFRKYAQDFGHYMDKWEIFNDKVLAHFTTRQEKFKLRRSQRGAKWLEDCVPDYITEVDQDLDVQKKHTDACVEHRKRIAEFMEFRDRVR